jgi:AcrR family transcriptional regulator
MANREKSLARLPWLAIPSAAQNVCRTAAAMTLSKQRKVRAIGLAAGEQPPALTQEVLDSREKLLAAALHLFATHGVDRVSVRDIARAAGVNSALVGYYFRGKQGLLSQLYRRHCEPMNAERIRLLESFSRGGKTPPLEKVLEAFVRPALAITKDRNGLSEFTRLRALLAAERSEILESLVAENFDRSSSIFLNAIHRCLPRLAYEDVLWRFHFLLGTVNYTAVGPHRITVLSEGRCDPLQVEDTLRELISFLAAGFRAPRSRKLRAPQMKTRTAPSRRYSKTTVDVSRNHDRQVDFS